MPILDYLIEFFLKKYSSASPSVDLLSRESVITTIFIL
ncbi:hypothetical protein SeH_A4254 [Salmonella enterica subsp. enterica serovar Hadar str. RI_05P066]|uniref:Uncharacterized protein n=2 Tax=Salmonella dublin TaxID=98360 RepID=A0A8X6EV90_SALDU|nr:hypothetical protein SeD_A4152 [Salmonella enterica subsp. enterica serovar Dublin str. CT_02021853]EDX50882.1 hypothetical protein SNSL317_A4692 [Salmonella enterica subsp. enterica serovar Newport str. SL317]EDZ37019.1 hypothetical protein SeH_A4254 [Salmonella enterica subsp. enterica serovar Hadar str. RI_05P066]EGE31847.1 hypothetical protein SD3246_4022 [Salmonella enterica subsp. enterica serovar Dublin str. SD3246]